MLSRIIYSLGKDVFLLILFSSLSIAILFNNKSPQILSIKSHISDIVYIVLYPQRWYSQLLDLKNENHVLKQNIAESSLDKALLSKLVTENTQLRKALRYNKIDSLNTIYPSYVTGFKIQEKQSTIIISKHEKIKKNIPVIDMYGIVGRVISSGVLTAQVQLISDKNFRLSVRVGEDRTLGIYKSTNGKYGMLDGIKKSASININDTVYTSGISKIYPSNIPVAKVIDVRSEPNKFFKLVEVEVLADIDNLEYVYTLHNK